MDSYVTGTAIRQLREAKHMTQAELAEKLAVSAKAISKWETAHGLPDISLLEPLAAALGVSVLELMQGEPVVNRNRSANLLRSKLYVCPLCGHHYPVGAYYRLAAGGAGLLGVGRSGGGTPQGLEGEELLSALCKDAAHTSRTSPLPLQARSVSIWASRKPVE